MLRIAFDLDGVLADMDGHLRRIATEMFDIRSAPSLLSRLEASVRGVVRQPPSAIGSSETKSPEAVHEASQSLDLTPVQRRRLWRRVADRTNFWEELDETEPGIVAAVADQARRHRWEVLFLTERPATAGDTVQVQSQRWLMARGFDLPSVFVVRGSRGKIADALNLDVVVDDRREHCLDVVVESTAHPILVLRSNDAVPANAARLGITVTESPSRCLTLLAGPTFSSRASA